MESTSTSSSASVPSAVTVSAEAAGGGSGGDRLQRHRSLHSPKVQSRNGNRSQKFDNNNKSSNHHRRATSVRVRPTYLLEDEDPSLPKPPVSINVACPDDEVEDSVNTLGHRLDAPPHAGGSRGRRRSLPRVPVYETEADGGQEADTEWSPYSPPGDTQYVNHNSSGGSVMFPYDPSVTSMTSSEAQMDQFDALFSKSLQLQQQQKEDYGNCPEVNIEVPSDSDSSRRPSKYTLSSNSSIQNINEGQQQQRIRRESFQVQNVQRRTSRGQSPAGGDFLAARMNLDRRRSHTGLPARRPSVQQPSQQQHSSHKRSPSPRGSMVGQSSMLLVPNSRPRGSSLPGNIEVVNQDDIYRLRNFSTSGKKLVNRGDSLKARSHTSIASTNSSADNILSSRTNTDDDFSAPGSASSSRRPSKGSRRGSSYRAAMGAGATGETIEENPPKQYRVTMLGATGVGKSALTSQFLSSDHMNTYDTVEDDVQKVVSVCVDGKESQMVFIDHAHSDMAIENQMATYVPDGYIVVYAIDDSESLQEAERILSYLKSEEILHRNAVIMVANKTDLVRSRVISTNAGKSLATKFGCKYIETSPGINHNVDELLVGMLTQIKLRENSLHTSEHSSSGKKKGGLKVLDFLERVWKMQDNKAKSCDNLQVL